MNTNFEIVTYLKKINLNSSVFKKFMKLKIVCDFQIVFVVFCESCCEWNDGARIVSCRISACIFQYIFRIVHSAQLGSGFVGVPCNLGMLFRSPLKWEQIYQLLCVLRYLQRRPINFLSHPFTNRGTGPRTQIWEGCCLHTFYEQPDGICSKLAGFS